MKQNQSSQQLSAPGFTLAESKTDIPIVLVEVEAECSTLGQELRAIAKNNPQWQAAVTVLAGRTETMLRQISGCRRLLTVQSPEER